ncbi:MAG: MerR family regulatory protein, partial [Pseudonocardiales bacterium]|nr:MerR family regulatory protein [Pseudonocardiales bacterium]
MRPSAPTPGTGQSSFTIAEVAARSGMSADTLRYYERIG